MSKNISRLRPSPAMVVAFIAVLGVAGGTAVAAPDASIQAITKAKVKTIAKNQANKRINAREAGLNVLSAQTANPVGPASGDLTGAYPNPTIGDAKVTETKIADNAVTSAKVANNAVTSAKVADAAVKAREFGNTQLAVSANVAIANNGNAVASATCPAGTQVLSGGGTTSSFQVRMVSSFQSGNGWIVAYRNESGAAQTITAIATCLSA